VDRAALKDWAEIVRNVVVALAAIVAGVWAYSRFSRERGNELALKMKQRMSVSSLGHRNLVTFSVTLENVGKKMISARPCQPESVAYDDGVERLPYSCCLQLRQIKLANGLRKRVDWFDSVGVERVAGVDDVNLLANYENPRKANAVEFWMEPGESYDLTASFLLDPGQYLAKITFLADGSDGNFWTGVMQFHVPEVSKASAVKSCD
jgi:hypothetical protein